jgi:hypothetical protein
VAPPEHLPTSFEPPPAADETGVRAKRLSPMTFVWLLLAIGTAVRLC